MSNEKTLSDDELASLADYIESQQASGKYGVTFAKGFV